EPGQHHSGPDGHDRKGRAAAPQGPEAGDQGEADAEAEQRGLGLGGQHQSAGQDEAIHGSRRRGSGEARQAAEAVAPMTITAPIWFFSYHRPRHRPAFSSWCTPNSGKAKTITRLPTAMTRVVVISNRGRCGPRKTAPR